MEQKKRLEICKICKHQKNDIQQGILCDLTQKKPNFQNSCSNFRKDEVSFSKIESELDKEIIFEENLMKPQKYHNPIGVILALGIMAIFLVFKYNNIQKAKVVLEDQQKIREYDKRKKLITKPKKAVKKQPIALYYLASKERVSIKRKLVKKDTSFQVAKNIKIVMHKKYFMSIIENDDTPVLSISRGYNFIYNKVKIDKSMSLTEQWMNFRQQLAPEFKYFDIKKNSRKGMIIEEKNFIIPGRREIRGAAKLIEDNEYRYFFQFFYKQQFEDYKMLHKYLNYYVKVK